MDKVISDEFKNHIQYATVFKRRLFRYGITSFDFGKKYIKGKETDQYAITCYVKKKLDSYSLPNNILIPQKMEYQVSGKRYKILTDVVEAKSKIILQSTIVPGNITSTQNRSATIGLIGKHESYGDILVTAGHLAKKGDIVVVQDKDKKFATANVEYSTSGSVRDFAILKITDRREYQKLPQWKGFYNNFNINDVGKTLYVYTGPFVFKKTTCKSVCAYFYDEETDCSYDRVISTERVTVKGNSGAALVDDKDYIWGLLIGAFNNRSIFMPIQYLLEQGKIQLI